MSQTITISLPDDTKNALDNAASEEGVSESALVEKAVSDYLFIRRFRNLREHMMSQGKNLTDQDVFDRVRGSSSRQRREMK
jgi:predicted transcriptional regulator